MSAFSDYLEEGILQHTLRGTDLPAPSTIYIALYTSDPTDAATGAEVTDSGYVRQDAAKGGTIESGWTSPATSSDGKMTSNAKLVQFPPIADGTVTISHYAIHDAQAGGNMLYHSPVDTEAERLRMQHITPGPGQAMTYEAKHRQVLAGGGAMITAEARALGITEQEVIDSVLAARERWELAGAKIETARIKAKRDIRQADTPQAMHQVVQRFKENLPA